MAKGSGSSGGAGDALRPHPLLAKLAEAAGDDMVVALRGFVGPEGGDTVRLYTGLDMITCLAVPRAAILHVEEPDSAQSGPQPTTVYVKRSTELHRITRHVTTVSAGGATVTTEKRTGPTLGELCDVCNRFLWWCMDKAGPEPSEMATCFRVYTDCVDKCVETIVEHISTMG